MHDAVRGGGLFVAYVFAAALHFGACVVAGVFTFFSSDVDPAVSGSISIYLLLLSRRLLQGLLDGPGLVHSWGAAQDLSRREEVSADFAKRPPLFSVLRHHLRVHPVV